MGNDIVVFVRFLLIGISLLLAFLAVITWNRRKDAPGAGSCGLLIGCMAIYAFGYSGEVAQTTVPDAKFWLDIEHLALPWAPALWLMTACGHNGRKVPVWPLFVIPVIDFVDHFANFYHSFYSGPMTMVQRSPFWVLQIPRGPVSMLSNAYLLVAFGGGAWIYLSGVREASSLFRKQAIILVLSSQLPIMGYFAYLTGFTPWGLDITPIVMGFSCCLFFYGFFHCGLYDLAPLGRTLIFNCMRDAALIVDLQNRLLDFNAAAEALLPVLDRKGIGVEITGLLSGNEALVSALGKPENAGEVNLGSEHSPRFYEIRTWPLISSSGFSPAKQLGQALIFADVTAQVHLREELRRRAETDVLTGIANRRRFHQALEVECLRFRRNRSPLSVLMIDLDHFKAVNDRYGHPAGDGVLRGVAQRLLACIRKTDLLARYGGEEFSILLPETRQEGAKVIAERIRLAVEQTPFDVEGVSISLSTSVGVASSRPENLETDPHALLKEADQALYRAKATGRNRVEMMQC